MRIRALPLLYIGDFFAGPWFRGPANDIMLWEDKDVISKLLVFGKKKDSSQ